MASQALGTVYWMPWLVDTTGHWALGTGYWVPMFPYFISISIYFPLPLPRFMFYNACPVVRRMHVMKCNAPACRMHFALLVHANWLLWQWGWWCDHALHKPLAHSSEQFSRLQCSHLNIYMAAVTISC